MEKAIVFIVFIAFLFGLCLGCILGNWVNEKPIKVQVEYLDNAYSEGNP